MEALRSALEERSRNSSGAARNAGRKEQIGLGERADRRRLWAFQRGVVSDQKTGKSISIRQALSGKLDGLWS